MKGPSLKYDLRVLRVFRCAACGREVHVPGRVTSYTCACSDPPKFMTPLERPKTVSPDVTAFLSAPDPGELVEEEIVEEPYVPYVPQLPPPRVQFPGRRKLSDEIERFQPPEFGVGVDGGENTASASVEDNDSSGPPRKSSLPRQTPENFGTRRERPQRHQDRNPGRNNAGASGNDRPRDNRSTNDRPRGQRPSSDRPTSGTPAEPPESDVTSNRSPREQTRAPAKPELARPTIDDDFGTGLEGTVPPSHTNSPSNLNSPAADEDDDLDDVESGPDESVGPDGEKRPRRRGRRRGRRRSRASGGGDAAVPPDAPGES